MEQLPIELLYQISHFLDPKSLFNTLRVCQKLRQLKPKFQTKSTIDTQVNGQQAWFVQKGEDLLFVRVNGIDKPTEKYPLGRRRGVRTFGDRCIVSNLPLGYLSKDWDSQLGQAVYFEVQVLELSNPLQSMRIGLVHPAWDQSRPPGSLNSSIGYCR